MKDTLMQRMWIPLLAFSGLAAAAGGDADADWPQFRGPNRDGISPSHNLLKSWPESGLDLIWRKAIGSGFSSVAIAGGTVYTMMAIETEGDSREVAVAMDLETGAVKWETTVGKVFEDQFGNGPRATPTLADGMVYVLGSYGNLLALNADDGSKVWEVDFQARFESKVPRWGYSCSPLVEGDMVLVEVGGGDGEAFGAFDRKTGEVRWLALDGNALYSSPIAMTVGGVRQYLFIGRGKLVALGKDGGELWSYAWPGGTIAAPLQAGEDRVFLSAGDDTGAVMLQITGKSGDEAVTELWKSRVMKNHFNSSVYFDGYIYGFDNATLKCLDAASGDQKWAKRGFGKGSLLVADGTLFVLSDRGQLVQAAASGEAFRQLGAMQALDGKCWTSPTLAGGRIYLRNHSEIASYDVSGPAVDRPAGLQ